MSDGITEAACLFFCIDWGQGMKQHQAVGVQVGAPGGKVFGRFRPRSLQRTNCSCQRVLDQIYSLCFGIGF